MRALKFVVIGRRIVDANGDLDRTNAA